MNPNQLRTLIQETLQSFDRRVKYSEDAVELLMMTASHESRLGEYIYQRGGPAMGIFQMEPDTFMDIKENYLAYRGVLASVVGRYFVDKWDANELSWNLKAAIIMGRLHYKRVPAKLPNNPYDMAAYAKIYWNTTSGTATPEDYLSAYNELVLGETNE